jgi:hypothetical protein
MKQFQQSTRDAALIVAVMYCQLQTAVNIISPTTAAADRSRRVLCLRRNRREIPPLNFGLPEGGSSIRGWSVQRLPDKYAGRQSSTMEWHAG